MIRASYNDVEYWETIYPVIDLKFVSEPPKPRVKTHPTLVDSGSPLSCLPHSLVVEELKLQPIEDVLDPPFTSVLGEVTSTCRVGVEISKNHLFFEFGVFPSEADEAFHAATDEDGNLIHEGLELFAIIGTDVFKDLLVAFDEQGETVFLGERAHSTAQEVLRVLEAVSVEYKPQIAEVD